jgi:ribosomal protein S18 acetylase RimI-like enzyme
VQIRIIAASAEADSRDIEMLLRDVYVGGGFTESAAAENMFASAAVLDRGRVLIARDFESMALAGMVIVVPATSPARRFAADGECEMHLLAVSPAFRRRGVGDLLVRAALESARNDGFQKMVLWTQASMTDAHRLYMRHDFERTSGRDFEKSGRQFLVYERRL